jgi:predicted amidohydrolase
MYRGLGYAGESVDISVIQMASLVVQKQANVEKMLRFIAD